MIPAGNGLAGRVTRGTMESGPRTPITERYALPDASIIRETFNHAADRYDRHAALEQEVCRRLLERCDFHRQPPQRILDLGCATGQGSQALKRKFPRAQVIGLDASTAMLARLRRRSTLLRPLRRVCADLASLPIAGQTMDLLFSNLANHWLPDPLSLFDEFRRVLRPGGLMLFATLGPGTLAEWCESRTTADAALTMRPLPDLMEVGDALVAAGFREPVMDMERITLEYPSQEALVRELECTGTSMLLLGWEAWKTASQALQTPIEPRPADGGLSVTFEIVYGTAFGPPEGQPRRSAHGDIATFSVDSLLTSRKLG